MQQLQQQRQARLAALAQLAGVQDERGLAQLQVLEARVGGDACMVTLDTICRVGLAWTAAMHTYCTAAASTHVALHARESTSCCRCG